ncbi:methyltransferase domain-containing protein, partial [Pelagibacterales bacterium SAG-MED03]|nr:methyltransferase domain-containing protein [Pelagibacterales bacterium SAG-MED03]
MLSKETNKFYSYFFKRENFLTYNRNFYTSKKYLQSLGYSKNIFKNKVVLEIGAGAGRLFFSLSKLSYLKDVKKFIIVEPSDGIDYIKKNCKNKKVSFQKKSFEDLLKDKSLYNNVDLIIFSGVIGHLNYSFEKVLKLSKNFLSSNGKILIHISYYGLKKKIDKKIKKINLKNSFLIFFLTFLKTIISYMVGEKFLKTYFVHSLEKNFFKRFFQFYEFYSVNPYKIFFNYNYYLNKINK